MRAEPIILEGRFIHLLPLPYKWYEALGALVVFWVLLGKEFEHDLLLLTQAQSEGDGDEDEQADTEDTAEERGSKRGKHDARIDRMAYVGIWASRHEFVMFLHRWVRTPVATEVNARPNRKADPHCSQCSTYPIEGEGWCKERMREENCSRGTSAAAEAHRGKDDDSRDSQAQHPIALP